MVGALVIGLRKSAAKPSLAVSATKTAVMRNSFRMGILYLRVRAGRRPQATAELPARELPTHWLQKSQSRRVSLSGDTSLFAHFDAHTPPTRWIGAASAF